MTKQSALFYWFLIVCVWLSVEAYADTPTSATLTLSQTELQIPFTIVEPSYSGAVLWGLYDQSVYRTTNLADPVTSGNWAVEKTFTRGTAHQWQGFFVDSNENLFIAHGDMGVLVKAQWAGGDSLTCTDVLTYECSDCPSGTCFGFWHMAEDSAGNLYFGEYNGGPTDSCAIVWKSTDSGDNWSRIRGPVDAGDRHIHFCAVDPDDDDLYISVGDGENDRLLLRSTDAGATQDTLHTTVCLAQPISFAFKGAYEYWGTDCATNYVYRTINGAYKDAVFTPDENNYIWCMAKDPNGVLVAGTVGRLASGNDVRLYGSGNGREWYTLYDPGVQDEWSGFKYISQRADSNGKMYYTKIQEDGSGNDCYQFSITYTGETADTAPANRRTPSRRRR